MDEYVITLLIIAALVAFCSWRERVNDNRRNSKIPAGIAATGVATAGRMAAA